METRFSFGGDEHLLCECSEEMSFEAFFKAINSVELIRESNTEGILEVCGGNAAYLVKFDPDLIHPDQLLEIVKELELKALSSAPVIQTRIIEVPVYYDDPWTKETMHVFRDRHQEPSMTDLEYAAKLNGLATVEDFISTHHSSPWFVSQVGFVCGVPWLYQLVSRENQIEVPKYVRPRTDTPRHTIGHGGCFAAIYAVRGAGGYQMFGITPMPIFEPDNKFTYFNGEMVFSKPGDIFKFKPIEKDEFKEIEQTVKRDDFEPLIKQVEFNLNDFLKDIDGYNRNLIKELYAN